MLKAIRFLRTRLHFDLKKKYLYLIYINRVILCDPDLTENQNHGKAFSWGGNQAGKSFLESNNSLAIWPSVSWLINNHFLAHHLWEQMGLNLKQRLLLVYLDLLHRRRRESAPDSHLIFITSDRVHGIQFYHFTLTTFGEFLNLMAGRGGAKKWRCTGCTTTSQLGTLAIILFTISSIKIFFIEKS